MGLADPLRYLIQHLASTLSQRRAVHDRGPDRSRVVNIDVDLTAPKRVVGDRRAEGREDLGFESGLPLDVVCEKLAQDILLREGLRADSDRSPSVVEKGEGKRDGCVHEEGGEHRGGAYRISALSQTNTVLEGEDDPVEQNGERCRRHAAYEDGGIVFGFEAR